MSRALSRRRFLIITAAGCAGAVLPVNGAVAGRATWEGTALGADARMIFANAGADAAEAAAHACRVEIERLEQIFSLYKATSEITRLNRDGALTAPSRDLVALMRFSRWFSERTGGAFDCTVQPVWRHLAEHFGEDTHRLAPERDQLRRVLARVGYRQLEITDDEIVAPSGGAVTLNGIAQGYITDRVADMLQDMGWRDVLVDLGEIRALSGRAWPVRLAASRIRTSIAGKAVATSAGSGTPLNTAGDWHHLIDPRTGVSSNHIRSVTVVARRATIADALSTALAVAAPSEFAAILEKFPHVTAYLQEADGRLRRI